MSGQRKILVVEADPDLRQTLTRTLASDGAFQVTDVAGVTDVAARMRPGGRRYDAIILAAILPDGDGVELCRGLRSSGLRLPIIIQNDGASEQDVVRGLDAGANDYVVRPLQLAELTARLRTRLREHETSEDVVLMIGPYHFRPGRRALYDPVANRRIHITQREVTLLKCLCRAEGEPVTRHALLDEIWGRSTSIRSHTVETHIYRLRRKIEANPAEPRILLNHRGGGYWLIREPPASAEAQAKTE
jgi:DNA-binding response OmpR family regulator